MLSTPANVATANLKPPMWSGLGAGRLIRDLGVGSEPDGFLWWWRREGERQRERESETHTHTPEPQREREKERPHPERARDKPERGREWG